MLKKEFSDENNIWSYNDAINFIENSQKFGIKLGLDTMKSLMNIFGNPHNDLKVIHVAGTNGKGSTVSYIERCLIEEGYKAGSYISPSLFSYEERIKIGGIPINKEDFTFFFYKVKIACEKIIDKGGEVPTEFELFTAVALLYFAHNNVDLVVMEVGLGGRFDATNIINPIISVITPIDIDHAGVLGDTYAKIAYEKAGIIKKGVPVVVASQHKEAMDVICDICNNKKSKLVQVDISNMKNGKMCLEIIENQYCGEVGQNTKINIKKCDINYRSLGIDGSLFDYDGNSYKTHLIGRHQVENAVLALTVLNQLLINYHISDKSLMSGIKNTRWECRLELIKKSPDIILDGAHNPHGAKSLVNAINEIYPDDKFIILLGMLEDKDIDGVINEVSEMLRRADYIIVTEPDSKRRANSDVIARKISNIRHSKVKSIPNYIKALEIALESLKPDEKLIIFGSFYLVASIRSEVFKSE